MYYYYFTSYLRGKLNLTFLLYATLFIVCLTGCCNTNSINATLTRADTLLERDSDSALTLLSSLNPNEIILPSLKAKRSLLYSMAIDKNYIDLKNDSVINYAVKYYKRKGNNLQKAKAYYYQGRIYHNAANTEEAIRSLIEAENHALKTSDHYLCGLIYNTLGNMHYSQECFTEAISMYYLSGKYFEKAGALHQKANAFSYVGKTYDLLNDSCSARHYYEMSKNIYIKLNSRKDVLRMNSGIALLMKDNSKEAANLLTEGYKTYNGNKILVNDYPIWATIHLKSGNLKEARQFALHALEQELSTLRKKAGLYVFLRDIEEKQGNYRQAYEYNKLYNAYNARASKEESAHSIQKIKDKYENEKLHLAHINLQKESRYTLSIYTLLIILVSGSSIFLIQRQRHKRKQMQENLERELSDSKVYVETIKENLAMLEDKYNLLEAESSKYNHLGGISLKAFENRLDQMKNILDVAYTTESNPKHFYKKFLEYINAGSRAEDAFGDLQYIVNAKYNGIIDHIKESSPTLSKADINFFSMLCFGFTPNAIRLIYGHTNLDSVFTKRKKLRNKLGIPASMQIETYIKKLKRESEEKNAL